LEGDIACQVIKTCVVIVQAAAAESLGLRSWSLGFRSQQQKRTHALRCLALPHQHFGSALRSGSDCPQTNKQTPLQERKGARCFRAATVNTETNKVGVHINKTKQVRNRLEVVPIA